MPDPEDHIRGIPQRMRRGYPEPTNWIIVTELERRRAITFVGHTTVERKAFREGGVVCGAYRCCV